MAMLQVFPICFVGFARINYSIYELSIFVKIFPGFSIETINMEPFFISSLTGSKCKAMYVLYL